MRIREEGKVRMEFLFYTGEPCSKSTAGNDQNDKECRRQSRVGAHEPFCRSASHTPVSERSLQSHSA